MTNEERISAVERFGYDAVEAQFLVMAALHGGYFLRRQFLAFVGGTKGWKDVLLLKKLAGNEHCRAAVYRHDRMVYHLSAKPLYDALGEPDNRNRREHQPSTVKNKTMALDFVLEHPAGGYLATEREKLDYFVHTRNIAAEDLPTRWYSSPRGHESKAKHFVESYPIFLSAPVVPGAPAAPWPHLCYVDEGLQTTDRFATYLSQYGRLFAALGDFHVIYVAEGPRLFASAERIFQRFVSSFFRTADPVGSDRESLLAYFKRRRLYENQDFSDFDTASLIRLREEKKRFAGESYEALYSRWKAGELASLGNASNSRPDFPSVSPRQFSTYLLEHDYDLFGTLTHGNIKRRNTEVQTESSAKGFGAAFDLKRAEPLEREEGNQGQEPGQRR